MAKTSCAPSFSPRTPAIAPSRFASRSTTARVATPTGGFEVGQQHALQVTPHSELDFCKLQFPSTVSQAANGSTVVYGYVYEQGVTPGNASSIAAWVGYGKKEQDPGLAWTWKAATYNTAVGNDNEYEAAFSGVASGSYAYAFRFQRVGTTSYCFGDLDGAGGGVGFNGEASGGAENLGVANASP